MHIFDVRNDSFKFMATMAVYSVAVCCASAYISRAEGQVGQISGNDGWLSVWFSQNQHGFRMVLS